MARGAIAEQVAADLSASSWIRGMFEKGVELRAKFGAENVHDFSLGNPNANPPEAFFEALRGVTTERAPRMHRYMPNAGIPETRSAVAAFVANEYALDVDAGGVVMTTGAAGGLNVVMRTICDPGDQVIVLAPYFPEYRFYIEHAGAEVVVVQTDEAFQPDPRAIEAAISDKTRAILVNSPNNPSGVVYSESHCRALAEIARRHDREERPLYLVLDDPYRRLVYDAPRPPTPAESYDRTILVSSYSKDLSVAGERCGYVVVSARVPQRRELLAGLTMLNRTLGFVNAPALIQRVIARCADACCDVDFYRKNRDRLCAMLRDVGYELVIPDGGMFVFPRTPIADDAAFVARLVEQRVLCVPGRGFGRAGHMRITFAVDPETIDRARDGFAAALRDAQ